MESTIQYILQFLLLISWTLSLIWINHRFMVKILEIFHKNNEILDLTTKEMKKMIEKDQKMRNSKGKEFYYE